ncbi:hypothetical protein FJZ53_04440 [Candidatus Woesearchaeota archaeon]|nr:hypothetical protein [Candidatus Woesearchaeota archaeon]
MALDKDIIRQAHEINQSLHENSSQYIHTRPVVISESSLILPGKVRHPFKITYDLKDLFTIGALTESSILMTGGTDLGKTTLALLVMNSLFGKEEEGWHKIDLDRDFGKDIYSKVDFSALTEGKTTEELYAATKFLTLPGLILDEINRLHAKLGNKLLHFFDKDIALPNGQRVKLGTSTENGRNYQFQIAAINEGDEYEGVFDMDKAMRRRTVIEIPMDIFTPTEQDREMIRNQESKNIMLLNNINHLEKLLKVNEALKKIPMHPTANMFIAYLESFDYCKNSPTREKGGVASKNGSVYHICTKPVKIGSQVSPSDVIGCEFLRTFENDLCPYVKGLTPGVSKNLIAVAKGFALLRATKFVELLAAYFDNQAADHIIKDPAKFNGSLGQYAETYSSGKELAKAAITKYFSNLEVEISDVEAAAGFVGYSKMGISNLWILKHYQGNRYAAVTNFCKEARSKLEEGLVRPEMSDLKTLLSGEGGPKQLQEVRAYCDSQNPWLGKAITPYISKGKKKLEDKTKVEDLYR